MYALNMKLLVIDVFYNSGKMCLSVFYFSHIIYHSFCQPPLVPLSSAYLSATFCLFLTSVPILKLFSQELAWFWKLRMSGNFNKECKDGKVYLVLLLTTLILEETVTWAITWQNKQHECAPRELFIQPGQQQDWVLSNALRTQWRLKSAWASAQADLSLHWAHTHFVFIVMSWLIYTRLIK